MAFCDSSLNEIRRSTATFIFNTASQKSEFNLLRDDKGYLSPLKAYIESL